MWLKKERCQWCMVGVAKPKPIVLNKDGSKNMSDPSIYICFFLALGITVTTRMPAEYQAAIGWLFVVLGAVAVIRLLIWRWRLPAGVEYRCTRCSFRWYEEMPADAHAARPPQNK